MADTRYQLRDKPRVVLALVIASPGITANELCRETHQTMASVSGTLVWLIHEGLMLRSYGQHPPCTYWATQKAQELYAPEDTGEKEKDT